MATSDPTITRASDVVAPHAPADLTAALAAIAALDGRLHAMTGLLDKLERNVRRLTRATEPFGVYMGQGEVLTQTMGGLRFHVRATDSVVAPKLVGNRVWEPRITDALPGLVRRDRDFVDVGANFGYFTVLVADLIGTDGGGRVIAFEPNPEALPLLEKNVAINWSIGAVEIRKVGLGERAETLRLRSHVGRLANARVLRPDETEPQEHHVDTAVEIRRLDDELAEPGRVGLVKIDVEGHELAVLTGASRLLRDVADVDLVVEWDRKLQVEGSRSALIDLLAGQGFRAWSIERRLEPIDWSALLAVPYTNILASRRL